MELEFDAGKHKVSHVRYSCYAVHCVFCIIEAKGKGIELRA